MNFELTPQQKAVQQSARQFAQTVLQETVLEDDAAGRFPEEAYKKMGEMGFVGLPFPKEYGGQGGDYLSYVLALEEISKINSSVGIAYSVCTSLYSGALINDGNEEQKKKYLPEVLSGKKMGSFCLTEPDAGSDAAGCKTTAIWNGKEYILNGLKWPYPQVIQKLFNAYWFGPPSGVTRTSTCSRVDHLVSRLPLPTIRPVQTRFRFGYRSHDP